MAKTKLELTWIGKDNRPRLEPRILLEDPDKSYHAEHRVTNHDVFDNRLIFGDNLLALKAMNSGRFWGWNLRPRPRSRRWCKRATEHAGGKPWKYLLIPHDAINESKTLVGLAATYEFHHSESRTN